MIFTICSWLTIQLVISQHDNLLIHSCQSDLVWTQWLMLVLVKMQGVQAKILPRVQTGQGWLCRHREQPKNHCGGRSLCLVANTETLNNTQCPDLLSSGSSPQPTTIHCWDFDHTLVWLKWCDLNRQGCVLCISFQLLSWKWLKKWVKLPSQPTRVLVCVNKRCDLIHTTAKAPIAWSGVRTQSTSYVSTILSH